MNRRHFLGLAGKAALASIAGGGFYGVLEAKILEVTRLSIRVPNLPAAFDGTTIALLSDIHHSVVVPRWFVEHAVTLANSLEPDVMILGGDFVTSGQMYQAPGFGPRYFDPCFDALKNLKAKCGIFAVTGNHDAWAGSAKAFAAIRRAGFENITNSGMWLLKNGARLRICGVGDLCTQPQNVPGALGDATKNDAVIFTTHNPDSVEKITDPRIGLMLCGHTHGGQVVLPFIGAPLIPSHYGNKYRYGLARGPSTQIFVTSGVGTLPLAVRINCPAEIALLTLTA